MPARLPVSCQPIAGESLNSFIVRLAEAMGYDSSSWVAELGGIKFPNRIYPAADIAALAELGGATASTLTQMNPAKPETISRRRFSNVLGHTVELPDIKLEPRRACPECLAESPHHRIHWDLRFVRVCPEHGCALISSCPDCGTNLGWKTSSLTRCRCGFDLTSAIGTPWPQENMSAARYIQGMLLSTERPPAPLLAGLSLLRVLYLIEQFGRLATRLYRTKFNDLGELDVEGVFAAGFDVLAGDIGSVRHFIGELLAEKPNGNAYSMVSEIEKNVARIPEGTASLLKEAMLGASALSA